MQIDIQELRKLLAEATPGPWEIDSDHNGDTGSEGYKEYFIGGNAGDKWATIVSTTYSDVVMVEEEWDGDENGPSVHRWDEQGRRNVALIVAAISTLPDLLDRVEELEAAHAHLKENTDG
jgi:hypothetical protein